MIIAILIGIAYLVLAVLHACGSTAALSQQYRRLPFRRQYQRGLVLPYGCLGIGWCAVGIAALMLDLSLGLFLLLLALVSLVPGILLHKNSRRFERR